MSDLIDRQAAIDCVSYDAETTVELLKKLPSAQPETHEKRTETHACDCISRQAAIDVEDDKWN